MSNKEEEDVDQVLSQFHKLDKLCSYTTCKTVLSLLGQQCQFCVRRFCLRHFMPEVHGCGDAVRRQARSASMMSSLPKAKQIDGVKRAHLQKKLDQKIQTLSTKRAADKKEDKKKK